MNILFIGDIVGKPGRLALKKGIDLVEQNHQIDFVIANGENVSHGRGLLEKHYDELMDCGVDVITLGNHYDNKVQLRKYIDKVDNIIRPLNLINSYPGVGTNIFKVDNKTIRVTNVLGSVFINELVTNPYLALKDVIDNEEKADIHIVDFHGEATSEKQSIAYVFDGQISALLGTHTHVQTNDARILEHNTAFMCDVGFCGAFNSVLGFETKSVIDKMIFGKTEPFQIEESCDVIFNAVLLKFDDLSNICKEIIPIREVFKDEKE